MATKGATKTWVVVLVAVIVTVCVAVIALVAGSAYYIAQHVRSEHVATEGAEAQFEGARKRLAGRSALIELREGGDPIIHRPPSGAKAPPITVVRALIYDPDDRKIVNFSLPVWLLRMAPEGKLSFLDDEHFDQNRVRFSFADIERHGPGLILDGTDDHGAQILIWSE